MAARHRSAPGDTRCRARSLRTLLRARGTQPLHQRQPIAKSSGEVGCEILGRAIFHVDLDYRKKMTKLDRVDVRRVDAVALGRSRQSIFLDEGTIGFLEARTAQHSGKRRRFRRDVSPYAFQYLRLGPIDPAADEQHALVIDVKVVARLQATLRAVADRGAEMGLVRRSVLGKARIAVD